MDLLDIRFYLQEKLRFHIWYLYIWYGLVVLASLTLLAKGFSLKFVLGAALVDMAIPTVIYLVWNKAWKKDKTSTL